MQGTRKITYASVANISGAKTVFSNAETWGQLQSAEPEMTMLAKGMKPFIQGATPKDGYALSSTESRLPEGDFVLYFLVDKNDSGK